ncbi:MAG: argininosuccinate synthase, partial [Fibrobacter sp.]|nr:argininosuccinate synthase [Fibrobacter sp.]
LDKETLFEAQKMSMTYANLVYNGQWFTPLRQAMDAFFAEVNKVVTGEVTLKLYKGNIIPAGIKSPYSLYDMGLGGFTDVDMYDQKDATGFIRCFGLPLKTRALLLGNKTNVDFGKPVVLPKK